MGKCGGREAESRKGKAQEAEGRKASGIPTILIPNLRLSKVRYVVRIKNRSLQPPTSMQKFTINLPNNPRLRGMSHHHQIFIAVRNAEFCKLSIYLSLEQFRNFQVI